MKRYGYFPLLRDQQDGYAAFVVSMIIMVVLSLIVLGFASNARAEQTRALNNQLSTEAYYAAESGINDAYTIITDNINSGDAIVSETDSCTTDNGGGNTYIDSSSSSNQFPTNDLSYSCLLVNATPQSLNYQPILVGQGQTVPVFGQDSAEHSQAVNYIAISWVEHSAPTLDFSGCPTTTDTFQSQTGYTDCTAGALQVDIVGADQQFNDNAAGSLIQNGTATVFLEPLGNSGSATSQPLSISVGSQIDGVKCNNAMSGYAYACTAILSVSNVPDGGQYYLHIIPFYYDEDVSISASTVSTVSQNPLNLYDAQVLLDSTGDADGSLKRLQERVCINNVCNNQAPSAALESTTGICKDFSVRPGFVDDNDNSYTYGTC